MVDYFPRIVHQLLLVATFVPFCWLAMQAVHELGHVIGAYATGGSVEQVVLHPLTISRTDLADNPRPLYVSWAGPIVGGALPVVVLALFKPMNLSGSHFVQFFSGFCLIANGVYIGVGSFKRIGDAGEMLQYGSPAWSLWLFGLCAVLLGLLLWHGLGKSFGLGNGEDKVERRASYTSCLLLVITLILELSLSPR